MRALRRLPPWPASSWTALPVSFLMGSVAGVMLIELVATQVFSGRAPLQELAVIRAFELLWVLVTGWRCRCLRGLGLGWPGAHGWRVFCALAVAACALAAVLAVVLWMVEGADEAAARLRWLGPASWLMNPQGLMIMALLAPLAEEVFFRGVTYRLLRQAFGWLPALALSSLMFAAAHGAWVSPPLAGGVLFALAYEWSRNLWVAVLLHAGANLAVWSMGLLWPRPF